MVQATKYISKYATIKRIRAAVEGNRKINGDNLFADGLEYAKDIVASMSEVERRRRSHWDEIKNSYGELEGWLCDCGREVKTKERFCPSCGAEMEE